MTEIGSPDQPRPHGSTALYRHFDAEGNLLYIGISDDPDQRLANHKSTSLWPRLSASRTVDWYPTRALALDAERAAVQAEAPLFNITHNAEGAEQRLVSYLIERGHRDMLVVDRPSRRQRVSMASSRAATTEPGTAEVVKHDPNRHLDWATTSAPRIRCFTVSSMPPLLLSPEWYIRERYEIAYGLGEQGPHTHAIQVQVQRILVQQNSLSSSPERRFDFLISEPLLLSEPNSARPFLQRMVEVFHYPNVQIGILPMGGRLRTIPFPYSCRIYGHIAVAELAHKEEGYVDGKSAAMSITRLELLWESAITGRDAYRRIISALARPAARTA